MFKSQDQNAGRSHYVQFDYSFFESMDVFKYVGTI
jgi:hypothetical protein